MKKNYVMATFAMLILAGCSNEIKEGDIKFGDVTGAKVTFSAVINNHSASNLVRATATSWEAGDVIGITCGEKQTNVSYEYTAEEGNYFKAIDRTKEVWLMGSDEYEVSAYYPFNGTDGVTPPPLKVETTSENQATEAGRQAIDYLYASGVANRNNPNVQLAFNHVMSRIVLTFQAGEQIDELSDIDCYITGLKLTGTFNSTTGETKVDEEAKEGSVNQVLTDENHHTMVAIFLPQAVPGNEILIEAGMNGVYYKVEIPVADLPRLEPGYSYNYTIVADKYNDNPIRLTVTGTQIIPWNNQDGGSFNPDPNLSGTDAETGATDWGDIENEDITPTEKK